MPHCGESRASGSDRSLGCRRSRSLRRQSQRQRRLPPDFYHFFLTTAKRETPTSIIEKWDFGGLSIAARSVSEVQYGKNILIL